MRSGHSLRHAASTRGLLSDRLGQPRHWTIRSPDGQVESGCSWSFVFNRLIFKAVDSYDATSLRQTSRLNMAQGARQPGLIRIGLAGPNSEVSCAESTESAVLRISASNSSSLRCLAEESSNAGPPPSNTIEPVIPFNQTRPQCCFGLLFPGSSGTSGPSCAHAPLFEESRGAFFLISAPRTILVRRKIVLSTRNRQRDCRK